MTQQQRHRVVIVGGGFGGLFAARFLKRADVDVTLIDRHNYHLFQPLLYQVATGILSEGMVAPPIRDILRRQRNVTVELATVTDIDLAEPGRDRASPGRVAAVSYPYDSLIVAAGRRAVVLRPRRVLALGAGDEDDRRRPGAARPDLRRVRDGRDRDRPDGPRRLADLRRRRRRPDRRRDRRPDRRTGPQRADEQLPPHRPGRGEGAAVRRRQGDPGQLRQSSCRRRPPSELQRLGVQIQLRQRRHRARRLRRRREGAGRDRRAHPGTDQGVGGRRAGVAAGAAAGQGLRGRMRPTRDGSRSCRTAPCPAIPRCSPSAT